MGAEIPQPVRGVVEKALEKDPAEVLRVLLLDEAAGRDAATTAMRRRAAGFPSGKTLESWREAESAIPLPTQHALATLEWLGRSENLVLAGPSGTAPGEVDSTLK